MQKALLQNYSSVIYNNVKTTIDICMRILIFDMYFHFLTYFINGFFLDNEKSISTKFPDAIESDIFQKEAN